MLFLWFDRWTGRYSSSWKCPCHFGNAEGGSTQDGAECLSLPPFSAECSLNAVSGSVWGGLLERRPAQHLFKCVCNLETFLGKQAHSEEGYLHAKAEEREEQDTCCNSGWWMSMMCFDFWREAICLSLSTFLLRFQCFSWTFKGVYAVSFIACWPDVVIAKQSSNKAESEQLWSGGIIKTKNVLYIKWIFTCYPALPTFRQSFAFWFSSIKGPRRWNLPCQEVNICSEDHLYTTVPCKG